MGPVTASGTGPAPGGLARVLARATLPAVAVPSPGAGVPAHRPPGRAEAVAADPAPADPPPVPRPGGRRSNPAAGEAPGTEVAPADPSPTRTEPHVAAGRRTEHVEAPDQGAEMPADVPTGAAELRTARLPGTGTRRPREPDDRPRSDPAATSVDETVPAPDPPAATQRNPDNHSPGRLGSGADPTEVLVRAVPAPAEVARSVPEPADRAQTPSPAPAAPRVSIGRIEVHVEPAETPADPFAGCRVVAAGLTTRRGGGW